VTPGRARGADKQDERHHRPQTQRSHLQRQRPGALAPVRVNDDDIKMRRRRPSWSNSADELRLFRVAKSTRSALTRALHRMQVFVAA